MLGNSYFLPLKAKEHFLEDAMKNETSSCNSLSVVAPSSSVLLLVSGFDASSVIKPI